MSDKLPAVHEVIRVLEAAGFIESSESDATPPRIVKGDVVHRAVDALQRAYPGGRLPPAGRSRWKLLLRYSRRGSSLAYLAADRFLAWLDRGC
jgi:hypothetical protein